MSCTGQCHGCALKPGAAANTEIDNRLTAIISALGGIPFLCHDRLGWTPDKSCYPDTSMSFANAHSDLLAAPRLIYNSPDLAEVITDATTTGLPKEMFNEARAVLGKRPYCAGWQATVASLSKQGWFSHKPTANTRRTIAKSAIIELEAFKRKESGAMTRFFRSFTWLLREVKMARIQVSGLEPTISEASADSSSQSSAPATV